MKFIITLSRQAGSHGDSIGHMLAERLNIECLDRIILEKIAADTGHSEKHVDAHEHHGAGFWQRNTMLLNIGSYDRNQEIFQAQRKIIREHAQAHSCVIIGRSADTILADFPNVLSVYVFAPIATRIENLMHDFDLSRDDAITRIKKIDAAREDYRKFFGHNADRRQLLIDSSCFGIEGSVDVIEAAVNTLFLRQDML